MAFSSSDQSVGARISLEEASEEGEEDGRSEETEDELLLLPPQAEMMRATGRSKNAFFIWDSLGIVEITKLDEGRFVAAFVGYADAEISSYVISGRFVIKGIAELF